MSAPKKRWAWPNMLPRPWSQHRSFPGTVISGEVVEDPRGDGKMCSAVCKVQGNAMSTYRPTMAFMTEVPEVVQAAIELWESGEHLARNISACAELDAVEDKLDAFRASLLKAGFTEEPINEAPKD